MSVQNILADSFDHNRIVDRLRKRSHRRPLGIACVGYGPFVKRNGQVSGIAFEWLATLFQRHGIVYKPVTCDWLNVFSRFGASKGHRKHQQPSADFLDVIADPTLQTVSRTVKVVKYVRIRSAILLYRLDDRHVVEAKIDAFSQDCSVAALQHASEDWFYKRMSKLIQELNGTREGFAVTAGVYEEELLRRFLVAPKVYRGPDIAKNAIKALKKKHLVLADFPSAKAVVEECPTEYFKMDVFTPLIAWPIAGFAVSPVDEDLEQFLTYYAQSEPPEMSVLCQPEWEGFKSLQPGETELLFPPISATPFLNDFPSLPMRARSLKGVLDISEILERIKSEQDLERLREFVVYLLETRPIEALTRWFQSSFDEWLQTGRLALGAIIEAAIELRIPGVASGIAKILAQDTGEARVVALAAQRIRLLVNDSAINPDLWHRISYWIDLWRQDPITQSFAALALPSVPLVNARDSYNWLEAIIISEESSFAEAAVLGVLDWAWRAEQSKSLDVELAGMYTETIWARLQTEIKNGPKPSTLIPALVWALGATATENQLDRVAQVIASSYVAPASSEDAAAVRSARMLNKRFPLRARRLIASELGGFSSELCQRFDMSVMHTGWRS